VQGERRRKSQGERKKCPAIGESLIGKKVIWTGRRHRPLREGGGKGGARQEELLRSGGKFDLKPGEGNLCSRRSQIVIGEGGLHMPARNPSCQRRAVKASGGSKIAAAKSKGRSFSRGRQVREKVFVRGAEQFGGGRGKNGD